MKIKIICEQVKTSFKLFLITAKNFLKDNWKKCFRILGKFVIYILKVLFEATIEKYW